jgi:hypothetical protein
MAVDLTSSTLTAAYYLAKKMYADDARKADYVADVDAAKAIVENSVSNEKIKYLESADKEHTARVYWSKFCSTTTSTSAPNFCSFTGNEADSAKKDYEIELQANASFTIDEKNYEDNHLNVPEVFADNMLKTKKNLDEKITQMLLAKLATFASANQYQYAGGIGCSDETGDFMTTFIPPNYWTPKVFAYFLKVAKQNKFNSPFLIDGENLFDIIIDAQLGEGNANGKGAAAAIKLMKVYSDLKNMTTVAPSKTYMVERGTIAFANKVLWKKGTAINPIKRGDHIGFKYSEASENIPGLFYDVYTKTSCSSEYEKVDVLVSTRFDLFNGTEGCNGQTGILEFECGACPTVESGS